MLNTLKKIPKISFCFIKKILKKFYNLCSMFIFKIKYNNFLFSTIKSIKFKKYFAKNNRLNIISSRHTLFIAQILKKYLVNNNIYCKLIILDPYQKRKFDHNYFIVLCGNVLETMPRNYFLFNLEQTVYRKWFTKKYNITIAKSTAILDYSLNNINYFKSKYKNKPIFHIPLCINKDCFEIVRNKNNKILFYGDDSGERRKKILTQIKSFFKIDIFNNCFEDKMNKLLDDYKIVLNIHSEIQGYLETCRIYEAISHNCIVVSEDSIDRYQYKDLEKNVLFFKCGDINKLSSILKKLVTSKQNFQFDINSLKKNSEYSKSCFLRFLLYYHCI